MSLVPPLIWLKVPKLLQMPHNGTALKYRVTMVVRLEARLCDFDLVVPLSAKFCLGICKVGRNGISVGQDCGTYRIKSTKLSLWPSWSLCTLHYSTNSSSCLCRFTQPIIHFTVCALWMKVPVLDNWWQTETAHAITSTCVGLGNSLEPPKDVTGVPLPGFDGKERAGCYTQILQGVPSGCTVHLVDIKT